MGTAFRIDYLADPTREDEFSACYTIDMDWNDPLDKAISVARNCKLTPQRDHGARTFVIRDMELPSHDIVHRETLPTR